MSDTLLRNRAIIDIQKQIADETETVLMTHWQDLGSVRYRQGIIDGLKLAVTLLEERHRNLNAVV